MKTMNLEQMECVSGGSTASLVCGGVFWGVGTFLGVATAVYSVGTAAVAGAILSAYIGALGTAVCSG